MTIIEQYAELCKQEKEIEKLKEELKDKLLSSMQEQQVDSVKTEFGTLSRARKLVYEYPEEYKLEESQVKASLKASKEEVEKTLTPTIKEYIMFKLKPYII